jgi:hypothetical protein
MGDEWFYAKDGQQAGPVTAAQLKQMAATGQVGPNDLVWKQGMAQWAPASQVKGLLGGLSEQRTTPAKPRSGEVAAPRPVEIAVPPPEPAPQPAAPKERPFKSLVGGFTGGAEPWFYPFLERFSLLAMILGLVLVGLAALALVFQVIALLSYSVLMALAALVGGLVTLALMALVVTFQVALIFLAVDVGRALRDIRRNTGKD